MCTSSNNRPPKNDDASPAAGRREFLRHLSALGLSLPLTGSLVWNLVNQKARSQTLVPNTSPNAGPLPASAPGKFVLTLHLGSWDGWACGLLQPRDVGRYPAGVFHAGTSNNDESVNPLLNTAYQNKTGSLVFHGYNSFLERIAHHMTFCVGNPQVINHGVATLMQNTGSAVSGPAGAPGWVTGVAQALNPGKGKASLVIDNGSAAAQMTLKTVNVGSVGSGSFAEFKSKFSDSANVPQGQVLADFGDVLEHSHTNDVIGLDLPQVVLASATSAVHSLSHGMPELAEGDAVLQSISDSLSREKVNALLDTAEDSEGSKAASGGSFAAGYPNVLEQLKLAAVLAKTGLATGMTVSVDSGDYHAGNSSVLTAQCGAQIFAQVTLFWEWVVAQGLQDHVLVIVTHEFSRSPYNQYVPGPDTVVSKKDGKFTFSSPGTDHHLAFGMVFLNGKVPPAARLGSVADNTFAAGSTDLVGSVGGDPYTSVQLVGTMLLRCFDDVFKTPQDLNRIWPQFQNGSVIKMLL